MYTRRREANSSSAMSCSFHSLDGSATLLRPLHALLPAQHGTIIAVQRPANSATLIAPVYCRRQGVWLSVGPTSATGRPAAGQAERPHGYSKGCLGESSVSVCASHPLPKAPMSPAYFIGRCDSAACPSNGSVSFGLSAVTSWHDVCPFCCSVRVCVCVCG